MTKRSARVTYGSRDPSPKQLAERLSAQCRRALDALRSEPSNRHVRDGEIVVHEPVEYDAGEAIGGRFRWETPFKMPVPVHAFGIYEYGVDPQRRSEFIVWAGQVVVLPDLSIELVDVFKNVPSHVAACVARGI